MVYSTCTVRKAENNDVVMRLLASHPEIELAEMPELYGNRLENPMTLFPFRINGCDGFFIAKFKKIY
ncbi:MAG: 16S rRNA (cytosine(967)-C(5))-methyltransferase RsmB, partial [Ruminococcus sp.]|nr:16S rRNA (cytosine(967)-C(5))-methyltransferase RsmB [Ruminococcus sp.]